jgi:hypothetical protein
MPVSNSATAVETCAVSAAGAVVPGSWTYVAGVWEAADNELLLYVGVSPDGTPTVGTPTVASRSASLAWLSTSPLFVGRASIPTSGYEYFSGEILDPAAFQGVADTIQLDHAAGLTYPWVFGGSS